jgi:malonate transporter
MTRRLGDTRGMGHALLLLPDFLLIALGFLICRYTPLNRPVWDGAERLVYYVLFPVLLFGSIVRSPLSLAALAGVGAVGLAVLAVGIGLAFALGRMPGVDARAHAAGAQVAFRFNSYVALALSERLAGASGVATMALLVAIAVPVVNVAAVWPLARHGGHGYGRELARNPLIIGTVSGLLANALGWQFPEAVATTLQRIGVAALPIGLLAVGAGLRVGGLKAGPGLAATLLGIRHVVLPAVGLGLTLLLALPPEQRHIAVLFAAMPTASSAFVLASRMGGDGPYVAALVTASTLLGMVSIPIWLALI